MDAQIRITGGADGELADLCEWLGDEDELRGLVRAVRGPVATSTSAERRTQHTEDVDYTIDIIKSNLPQWDISPES